MAKFQTHFGCRHPRPSPLTIVAAAMIMGPSYHRPILTKFMAQTNFRGLPT